jgi:hypothetical protein
MLLSVGEAMLLYPDAYSVVGKTGEDCHDKDSYGRGEFLGAFDTEEELMRFADSLHDEAYLVTGINIGVIRDVYEMFDCVKLRDGREGAIIEIWSAENFLVECPDDSIEFLDTLIDINISDIAQLLFRSSHYRKHVCNNSGDVS